jgi:L-ascorbate metabolism protein UlaG (beta-lactamase superfamily)
MRLIAEMHQPDLLMLPIGDHFTMGPAAAAQAIRLTGATRVLPMHYGTFPLLTGTPEKLRELTTDIPDLQIYDIKPGEKLV